MGFYDFLASRNPQLKKALKIAKIEDAPEDFLRKSFRTALIFATAIAFTFFALSGEFSIIVVILFFTSLFLFFNTFKNRPILQIKQRRQKIDRDLLFAGQYMLVKLQSGLPLFNSLIHASKEYNETGFFFRGIVQDITTGTPMEVALGRARDLCPSDNMKKILTEIVTSLKTGADVVDTLRNSLEEISKSLMLEVKAFNKKLNSIMMFYMILGTVLPSIGIALLIIFLSFAGILLNAAFLIVVLFFLALLQMFFVAMVNNSRPTVNL